MEYLVAVLSDRQQAEAAYSALAEQNLPMEQVSLLGEGHESADEFGLIEPNLQAKKQSSRLAYWLIPFGFAAGYAFNVLTHIALVGNGGIFDHLFGGILGAASAALGAVLVGGAVGWTTGSGDALAYRNRLNAGKYLIVAKGTDALVRQATRTLRQFEPENIQGYTEPATS
ncbi:hypothetical protein IQ241_17210 [Romeria aff. gracilis LEGE 07310]|uniref:Uncharacterized protein n=1 Tax=Vasconcelosia minhoensis LEGE 07310 TaxID=915328 RepID=A0A8J7AR22_9CYAN|nr:hypothetical protein [Romeria gracilis]MBE9079014.1 hypothetical protein [Romeria aff. gracilis LEGE 07310]